LFVNSFKCNLLEEFHFDLKLKIFNLENALLKHNNMISFLHFKQIWCLSQSEMCHTHYQDLFWSSAQSTSFQLHNLLKQSNYSFHTNVKLEFGIQ